MEFQKPLWFGVLARITKRKASWSGDPHLIWRQRFAWTLSLPHPAMGTRRFGLTCRLAISGRQGCRMPGIDLSATTGLWCVPGFLGLAGLAVAVGRRKI